MKQIKQYELANYLAYELTVKVEDTIGRGVLVSVCTGMAGLLFYEEKDQIEYYDLHEIKPFLLPLKSLVMNNPQTGKPYYFDVISKSCPLPFLGKNNKHWKHLFTGTRQVSTADDLDKWLYLEIDNHYNDFSFSIDLLTGDLTTYRNGELETTDNQAAYIQELYKYHFDVNNLINQELALLKV